MHIQLGMTERPQTKSKRSPRLTEPSQTFVGAVQCYSIAPKCVLRCGSIITVLIRTEESSLIDQRAYGARGDNYANLRIRYRTLAVARFTWSRLPPCHAGVWLAVPRSLDPMLSTTSRHVHDFRLMPTLGARLAGGR